jgi:hypothetical protein
VARGEEAIETSFNSSLANYAAIAGAIEIPPTKSPNKFQAAKSCGTLARSSPAAA